MEAITTVTMQAGQDLSAHQYHFVSLAADGQIDPTGAAALADGVLMNKPAAAGEGATVTIFGIALVKAGAAVAVGDLVASDSTGRAVTAVSTNQILGKAMTAAGAAGEFINVLLKLSGEATKA